MNWGKWIIVAFVVFAGFIATLVTITMRQDISLVSDDYYTEELAYGKQIQRLQNSIDLPSLPRLHIAQDTLWLAMDDFSHIEHGELKLFCPSNQRMDRSFPLERTSSSSLGYAVSGLQKGMYRVKLLWAMNGKEYYYEEMISI